jgi:hypothetical protein
MFFSSVSWAQSDINDILQSHFANNTGPIYLESEYVGPFEGVVFDTISLTKFFNEEWEPLPHENIPNKEPFIAKMKISDLVAYSHNESFGKIDFRSLGEKFVGIDPSNHSLQLDQIICRISKPFINDNEEWSLFFLSFYSKDAASGGSLYIYRKVDGQWKKYHTIALSFYS